FTPNNTTLAATYTPTAAEMSAGTVTLTLTTNAPGKCPAKDDQMTIRINPVAVVDAGPDQTICANGSATLAAVVSGSATSGVWSGGTGNYSPSNSVVNPTYTPSLAEQTAGKVVLTFTSNDPVGPCPAVYDEMTIFIDQLPVAIAGETKAICDGQQIQLEGSVKNTTGGVWSEGTGTFKKDNTDLTGTYIPSAQEIIAGKVTLILTSNTNGLCPSHKDTVTFTINPNPVIDFSVNIPKACPDHCVNFTDLTTVGGNTKIDKWIWNFSIDSSKIQNPTNICFVKPGFYDVSLTAISDAGCKSSLTKPQFIETYPEPTAAFRVNPTSASIYDPSFNFYNQSSLDVVSWTWNLGDGKIISPKIQNPSHTYELGVSGTYTIGLFVANNYGCVDTTYRNVEVLPEFTFFIPNAFTPYRNDGTNDTFFGKGVGIIAYHIWIFDRWGNMVFDTTDINHGWDGRANGGQDIAQQDVFVWKVKLTDIFNRKHDYIGTVTLVR
ncbi:MAG TPA: PKD domain-containing protein, partial [Bacteroidia bacterium]|nr:PKD domain-containing protein [Bacteroidia bacterium]